MTARVDRAELIVYATPTGALAGACRSYWGAVAAGPSTAQDYPPHCSMTGFFHRPTARVGATAEDLDSALEACPSSGPVVEEAELMVTDEWVGLALAAPWLEAVTRAFASRHAVADGDDAVRPKDWLHLSLAYGDGFDPARHAALAAAFEPVPAGGWEVGLWERTAARSWRRISPGP